MEEKTLSPEESLKIISQVISQARNKFEENGFIYVFRGILIAIAAFSQFILLQKEYFNINWYPYLLMPLGALFTGFYYSKKKQQSIKNQISKMVSISWLTISVNILILGFIFAPWLKQNLTPIILILLSVGILVSAGTIKSRLLYFSGLIINVSAFICFYLDWVYHPLLMGFVGILAMLLPGILLMVKNKKGQNV
jgi:uncharacterized membrane protein